MVLESILTPNVAEQKPLLVFILGLVYGALALFLALWIFEDQASMVLVFLVVLATLPLMYHTLCYEEEKGVALTSERSLLREHSKALKFFMALFIGIAVALTILYVVLPTQVTGNAFRVQTQTIASLNQHVTGRITQTALLSKIFLNNVKVMIFCILFSFIYGSGAIFILTWNASVIAAAAGNFIRSHLAQYAGAVGLSKVAAYFYVAALSILRYAIHGLPEILSYFIAGLAGGILAMAIAKHDFGTQSFEKVLLDVSDLVLLAVLVLFIAAVLEVFVTPALF